MAIKTNEEIADELAQHVNHHGMIICACKIKDQQADEKIQPLLELIESACVDRTDGTSQVRYGDYVEAGPLFVFQPPKELPNIPALEDKIEALKNTLVERGNRIEEIKKSREQVLENNERFTKLIDDLEKKVKQLQKERDDARHCQAQLAAEIVRLEGLVVDSTHRSNGEITELVSDSLLEWLKPFTVRIEKLTKENDSHEETIALIKEALADEKLKDASFYFVVRMLVNNDTTNINTRDKAWADAAIARYEARNNILKLTSDPVPPLKCSHEEFVAFVNSLVLGERVIECGQSALYGRQGTVYFSEQEGVTKGSVCVLWDKLEGEEGQMGTSVTGGARRLKKSAQCKPSEG